MSGLEPIGSGVRRELARFPAAAGMTAVVAAWERAVGTAIARNAWPARIARDGTLHVAAASSAWAFELTHLAGDILARLREALPPEHVPTTLRFAPGRLPAPPPPDPGDAPPRAPAPSEEARSEAARLAAAIGDESLRSLIARAAAASLSRAPSDRPL